MDKVWTTEELLTVPFDVFMPAERDADWIARELGLGV